MACTDKHGAWLRAEALDAIFKIFESLK
jgi:hypothetical protein